MRRAITTIGLIVFLGACAQGVKPYEPNSSKRTIFLPVVRQNAPEPVYSRLRWVQPPEVLPERDLKGAEAEAFVVAPPIRPVYQMTFKNIPLHDVSRILAATARYEAYCAPSISDQKISMNDLGTIDELGKIISNRAGISVVVNHEDKTVRFDAHNVHEPQLYNE